MKSLRHAIAALALAIVPAGFAGAATYFTGDVTKVAADLYEGPSGELINTIACAQAATATPALVRIDANTGAVIGRITFGGVAGCDIAAVYAPYVGAPAGTYAAVVTRFDTGYYADTTVEPFWIVRGAPSCPAATATPAYVTLAASGPTYVPPGDPIGTIAFSPGAGQQSCALIGVFGKVDLSTISAYPLAVAKDGSGNGTVTSDPPVIDCGSTCTADFGPGTQVTLAAAPAVGSTFAGWSGACSGSGPCTVTVDSAIDVTATFLVDVPLSFSLSVAKAGTGTGKVTSSPAGIDCGATCSANFVANVPVTLTPLPDAGSSFSGWSGACTGSGACVVPMSAASNVTATFVLDAPVTYPLAVTRIGTGSGAVTSNPAGINCGTTCAFDFTSGQSVTLQAVADAGSVFAGWSGAGCTGTAGCTVTMNAAKSVTATFANAAPATFALTVTRAGAGSGSVVSTPAGINCGTTCQAEYAARTVVTLTATPSAGSVFTGWSGGGCSGTGSCSVSMDAAKSVTATFTVQQFTLTVSKTGGGGGLVTSTPSGIDCGATCNASFNSGVVVALGAAPSADSFFAGWSGSGCTGVGACNVTMDAAKSVTATFKLNTTIPRLANIATRMQVLTGADVMIGGFIIGGSTPKTVVVRARGPSLTAAGVPGALANPVLQLFAGQVQLAANDNWQEAANAAAIQSSGFAPADPFESAILTTLAPGAYTAIVSGAGGGTGVGIVEVFEVDLPQVPLLNIATRGKVLTGADVMIGGFIIQGDAPQTVIVRARGPSLTAAGVPGALQDPVLQLFSGQTQIGVNDDWQTDPNAGQIQSRGFAPADARESAILVTLPPGAYTAIVTGKNGTTGVAIIEVFAQ